MRRVAGGHASRRAVSVSEVGLLAKLRTLAPQYIKPIYSLKERGGEI